jgi:sensor domain CHASE-containing protein
MILYPVLSHIVMQNGWEQRTAGGLLIAEWMSLLLFAFALLGIVQRLALASRLSRG